MKFRIVKDGNKFNNNVSNLEWTTKRKNFEHSYNILNNTAKGQKNGNSRLTNREVKFMRWLKDKFPKIKGRDIAKFYGMSNQNIYDILNKRNWKDI